ncbi:MAG: YscO family type III secretion system apparatus protein [Verrucomicrobiota bacterium]
MSEPGYPLAELVSVRTLRETTASREVSVAQLALEEAQAKVLRAKEEHKSYIAWRIEEEKISYEKVMNQQIHLAELETLKQEIRGLREREVDLQEAIIEEEKKVEECATALGEAKVLHQRAVRDLEKLHEHRQVWESERAAVVARKEEDEMDDFRVASAVVFED